jgi:hypothetical protein
MAISVRNLCTPAYVYLAISVIALLIMLMQNIGLSKTYCLGDFSCDVSSTTLIFIVKIVYILFWTWILDLICKSGNTNIAWFLVLLPFIILFIFIAMLML